MTAFFFAFLIFGAFLGVALGVLMANNVENSSTSLSSDKSRFAVFLLSFFLGALGFHRFYVGKWGSGLAMLLLTLSFFGLIVSVFWNLVDWIVIIAGQFKDAEDRRLER